MWGVPTQQIIQVSFLVITQRNDGVGTTYNCQKSSQKKIGQIHLISKYHREVNSQKQLLPQELREY